MSTNSGRRSGRNYINKQYERHTDDICLLYKSIPMAVASKMLTPSQVPQDNGFPGIKKVEGQQPSRPVNLLTMAASLSRMTGEPLNVVAKRVLEEERNAVKTFVKDMRPENKKTVLYELEPYKGLPDQNVKLNKELIQSVSEPEMDYKKEVDNLISKVTPETKRNIDLILDKVVVSAEQRVMKQEIDSLLDELIVSVQEEEVLQPSIYNIINPLKLNQEVDAVIEELILSAEPIEIETQTDWSMFKQGTPGEKRFLRTMREPFKYEMEDDLMNDTIKAPQTEMSMPPQGGMKDKPADYKQRVAFYSSVPSSYETPQSVVHTKEYKQKVASYSQESPEGLPVPKRLFH